MPTPQTDVSIVIPCFNAEATITRTLDSIAAQTLPNVEIIVVDDGSTDGTRSVVERWAQAHAPSTVLVEAHHNGVAAARNAGVAASSAALIGFIDADDEYLPDALTTLTRLYADNPDSVLVFGDAMRVEGDAIKDTSYLRKKLVKEGEDFIARPHGFEVADPFAANLPGAVLAHGSFLADRATFAALGPCDPAFSAAVDRDMLLSLAAASQRAWVFTWDHVARIHYQAGSISSRDNMSRHAVNQLKVLAKHRKFANSSGHAAAFRDAQAQSEHAALYWASAQGPAAVLRVFRDLRRLGSSASISVQVLRRWLESWIRSRRG